MFDARRGCTVAVLDGARRCARPAPSRGPECAGVGRRARQRAAGILLSWCAAVCDLTPDTLSVGRRRLAASRWHVTLSAACTAPTSRVQRARAADASTDATGLIISVASGRESRQRSLRLVEVTFKICLCFGRACTIGAGGHTDSSDGPSRPPSPRGAEIALWPGASGDPDLPQQDPGSAQPTGFASDLRTDAMAPCAFQHR